MKRRLGSVETTAEFLAPIFAAHPDRVRDWVKPDRIDADTRAAVSRALWLAGRADLATVIFGAAPKETGTPPDLRTTRPTTPDEIDRQWARFMATGDTIHVHNIVDMLDETIPLSDDRTAEKQARAAAAWSLGQNAVRHEKVLRALAAEASTRSGPVARRLAEIAQAIGRSLQPLPLRDGEFSALVVVAEPAALAEALQAGTTGGGPVRVPRAVRVGRDRQVVVKALFMGQKLAEDLSSDVTWDLAVTDPAGKPWTGPDLVGLEGFKGRTPTRFRLFDSRGFATIWFDAKDIPGVYRIEATVRDRIGGRSISFSETIEYAP